MIKYYKILQDSGVTYFVKTTRKTGNTIEISCHEEEPYQIHCKEYIYYAVVNGKLNDYSTFGKKYKNYIVSFEEITEQKFQEILKKFLCKI